MPVDPLNPDLLVSLPMANSPIVVEVESPDLPLSQQAAIDVIDEASMESFPCSDPPGYTMAHS